MCLCRFGQSLREFAGLVHLLHETVVKQNKYTNFDYSSFIYLIDAFCMTRQYAELKGKNFTCVTLYSNILFVVKILLPNYRSAI